MERYTGFYIDKPYGNNVFSYEERENKRVKTASKKVKGWIAGKLSKK